MGIIGDHLKIINFQLKCEKLKSKCLKCTYNVTLRDGFYLTCFVSCISKFNLIYKKKLKKRLEK